MPHREQPSAFGAVSYLTSESSVILIWTILWIRSSLGLRRLDACHNTVDSGHYLYVVPTDIKVCPYTSGVKTGE